ncbi:MAG: hypothetical protein KC621_23430, partial [Myxococcales bacterium]|nr:hypothetical protein [Myxococcales bacterium]
MRSSLWLLAVSLSGCALTEFPADPDGDGVVGANDCDPADGSVTKLVVWPDTDGDGLGAGEPVTVD